MIDAIPIWVSFLAFVGLQTAVLLATGLPLWLHKRAGGKIERETWRQFRSTNLTVAAILFVLLDAIGILRALGVDPMMALVRLVVGLVDFLRSF